MASVGRAPEGVNKPIPGAVSNPTAGGNPNDPPIPNSITAPKATGNVGIPGAVSNPKGG
jgi:hypothetical protein